MTHVNISTFPVNHQVTGLDIEVHLPKGLLDMKAFEKKLPRTLKNIAKDAKQFWESEAGRKLKTARVKYREGVKVIALDNRTILIELDAFGATLEKSKGFDMKPGFMSSPNVKIKGHQKLPKFVSQMLPKAPINVKTMTRYLIIPMRYSQGGTKFRTVSDKSPKNTWIWKRKDETRDLELSNEVVKELQQRIIPEHIKALIEEVWRTSV